MKRILLLALVFCLCLSFSGCGKDAKLMKQVEEKIFSYGFDTEDVRNLEEVASTGAFEKWIKKVAPKIANREYSEIEISALIDNLERAEVYDPDILEAFHKFRGTIPFAERLKNESVIQVIKELKKTTVYSTVGNDYYRVYRQEDVKPEWIWEAAKAQLQECNLETGYYDDPANRKENEDTTDEYKLVLYSWAYTYRGDFCIETKRTYNNVITGEEISGKDGIPRIVTIYYKGEEIHLGDTAVRNAQGICMNPETMEFIAYTKAGEIYTSFGITVQ